MNSRRALDSLPHVLKWDRLCCPGELCDPGGLVVLSDEVIVCDISNHRLQCFSIEGRYTRAIGRRGVAPGCFTLPSGIATTSQLLLVAERRRVQVLTAQGVPLQVVLPDMCGSLQGITCLGSRVLVADSEARLVHEFTVHLGKVRMLQELFENAFKIAM
ncbi:MAG: hypothetical protein SGPRY_001600 [Prymnesium sp.]